MGPHRRSATLVAVAKAILPWCLLLVAARPLLTFQWPPPHWSDTLLQWLWFTVYDIAFFLSFLVFAGGVALRTQLGYSRRAMRAAVMLGIASSLLSYSLSAWTLPLIEHRELASFGAETADAREFGPRTPTGVLRNLRFVKGNPPDNYTLSVDEPRRFPPDLLLWELHLPAMVATFAFINVFLGLLAAELTIGLQRGRRRNALLAIGILGAIAFQVIQVLAAPTRSVSSREIPADMELMSGVVAAWIPLAFPVTVCVLLLHFVRSRRY